MSGRMKALMPAMALAMVGAAGAPDAAPASTKSPRPTRGRGEGARLMSSATFDERYYRGIGNAIRSKKRDHKRALMAEHGITSGRQWRKLRKTLRGAA